VVNKEVEQQFWEGCDIVTRETCVPTSLNINNLGKAAVPHFASHSLLRLGPCQTQPVDYCTQLCLCQVLIGFSQSVPHSSPVSTFVEEAVFSPFYVLDGIAKNQVGRAVWIHI
jgi:hypothetical protein